MATLAKMKSDIDKLTQMEACHLMRFAPTGHVYFVRDTVIGDYFAKKYKELGGMTSTISKALGWGI